MEKLSEEEVLELRSGMLKKEATLLRIKCTFTLLNLEFFKLYKKDNQTQAVEELVGRFDSLIKDILEIENGVTP